MCYQEMLESSKDNGRNSRETLTDASAGTMQLGFVCLMEMGSTLGILRFSAIEILHADVALGLHLAVLADCCLLCIRTL